MIPLYLSLMALSCLTFAGAAPSHTPLHIPLVVKRERLPVEEYGMAAHALRIKYGIPHSSASKRQHTAAIPITNQVCPCSARKSPPT